MPKCTKCGTDFHGVRCPACGENVPISAKALNKRLQKHSYLMITGLVGIIVFVYVYPLLDENPVLILCSCLFFFPILMQIGLIVRKRYASNIHLLRRAYLYSSSILVLIAVFLALNGMADRAPAHLVETSIIRKYVSSGRHGTTYHVVVSSWRLGVDHERLRVTSNAYRAVFVGEPVVVEMHPGLFALPWYGRISPK